jgi:hypothetical protein
VTERDLSLGYGFKGLTWVNNKFFILKAEEAFLGVIDGYRI